MSRSRAPWIVAGVAAVASAGVALLGLADGSFTRDATFTSLRILITVGYIAVGALIASRRVGGSIGWLMLGAGIGFLTSAGTTEYVLYTYRTDPGALPFGTAAAWLNGWAFIAAAVLVVQVLVLFPTGAVPTRRWRLLPRASIVLGSLAIVGGVLKSGRLDLTSGIHVPNPTGVPSLNALAGALQAIGSIGLVGSALAAILSLVLRFRRSRGEERQQLRWLAFVGAASFVSFLGALVSAGVTGGTDSTASAAFFLAFLACLGVGIPVASGLAILRYRLWDLDLVIRKAVIFALVAGALTVLMLLVAVAVPVAVAGAGMSAWERGLLVVGIALGTLTGPLLRRARRLADRLVYGGRATPYEVLTEFSGRLAETYSTDEVVPRMAAILGSGTGARSVTIWLRVGRDLRPVASWPDAETVTDSGAASFEVRHQGEPLGAVTVSMPANDPMTPDKGRLVRDLAAQAGLVLRNVRLIEELRESRRRIVAAQDERARKLERNIHDGAQQQLVALAVKVRLTDTMVGRDAAKARVLLEQIQAELQEALDTLRDLARGIYPPLLADKGLHAALAAQAAKSALPVRVWGEGIGRYDEDVEAAVYFCALEALQNASKYSGASRVDLRLSASEQELSFEIRDDGAGFDQGSIGSGTGLQGMSDRIEAVGGRLGITSAPGEGTRIAGTVPVARSGVVEDPATAGNGRVPSEPAARQAQPADAAPQADSSLSGPNADLGM